MKTMRIKAKKQSAVFFFRSSFCAFSFTIHTALWYLSNIRGKYLW